MPSRLIRVSDYFLKRILNERTGFYFQSEIMDMKEEMMNDAIDDVMGDEEDDEER